MKQETSDRISKALNHIQILLIIFLFALVCIYLLVMTVTEIGKNIVPDCANCTQSSESIYYWEPMIDKIGKDCGSTFITSYKQPNQKGKYSVFMKICKEGDLQDYCKYDYISLENCLK